MTKTKGGITLDQERTVDQIMNGWLKEEDAHNIFAFVGGFVDSAGYMKLQGLFTSAVTGNLIAALASIYNTYGVVARVFVVLAFTVGAITVSGLLFALKMRHQWSPKSILVSAVSIEIAFLLVAMLCGRYFDSTIEIDHSLGSWQLISVASLLGVAMGAQCACVRASFPRCPPTTVLTTILVSFSVQAAHGIHYTAVVKGWSRIVQYEDNETHLHASHAANTQALINSTRHLLSFLVGGLLGAVTMETFSFWSFSIPMVVLMGLMLDVELARRKESFPDSADTNGGGPTNNNGNRLTRLEAGFYEDGEEVETRCISTSDCEAYAVSSHRTTRNTTLETDHTNGGMELMSLTSSTALATPTITTTIPLETRTATDSVDTLRFILDDIGEQAHPRRPHRPVSNLPPCQHCGFVYEHLSHQEVHYF